MTRLFKDHSGREWDLDNPETYEKSWFPSDRFKAHTCDELRIAVENEVGMSLYYMLCWSPGDWGGQLERVVAFGKNFRRTVCEEKNRMSRVWLLSQLFLIMDETENQC